MSALGAAGSAAASARSAGWKSAADATLATATSAVTAKVLSFMIESAGRSVGQLVGCPVSWSGGVLARYVVVW